ncbi:hypothetical protein [Cellulomonas endometrii]|uniref:hypothetical protein n=1 Tax=Cellulomonas endometrii TaxID=3036301 RepID=UPI0024AC9B99|nr:hypothetical protein [Cellulomonas endometrii]
MELARIVVFIISALLVIYDIALAPAIHPKQVGTVLTVVVALGALTASGFDFPVLPRDIPVIWLVLPILFLAVLSPLLGLWESRRVPDGQRIFSTGRQPGVPSRFRGHLTTNVVGAAAVGATVWAALSTPGLSGYLEEPRPAYVSTIALPLAWLVVRAFISWQQSTVVAGATSDGLPATGGSVEEALTGYSLRHAHQLTNVVFLTLATFVTLTMVFYLLDYAIARSTAGDPLSMSWAVVLAATMMLAFLLACGSFGAKGSSAVYLTFLTGTPAALVGVILWFSLYESGVARTVATVAVVTAGYLGYSTQTVLAGRRDGEKFQAHYFSATAIAVVIVALLGSLYAS